MLCGALIGTSVAAGPRPVRPEPPATKPTSSFYKVFGGKNYDATADICRTKAGGYLITGRTNSFGNSADDMNVSIVKLDGSANVVWEQNLGGKETDEGVSITETRDGGALVAATSDSYGGGPDMKDIWIIKLDKDGKKQWDKVLGGNESIDEARAVLQLEDGHFILLGNSTKMATGKSDAVLLKLSEKGELVWKRNYGVELGNEEGNQLLTTKDGGFIIAGNKEVPPNKVWNFWVVAADKDGFKTWEQTYGGKQNDRANSIAATADGYVLCGYTYSFAESSHDIWVVKIDAKGQKQWDKVLGGPSTDEAQDVLVTKDGQILVVGYTDIYVPNNDGENTSTDGNDALAVMFDNSGKELWKKHFGGKGAQRVYSAVEDATGNLVLAGFADTETTDHLVVKMTSRGQMNGQ
ncbi:MAG: hypothetical protein MUC97_01890 [Bernardetiaceae bacterium]|jgi:hypothetical protein|nr:hypothetical protein [Bernardetiaceae bacterium]